MGKTEAERGLAVNSETGRTWDVGHGRAIDLSHGVLMAIINVTPDSFSDGGRHAGTEMAIDHALKCAEEGALILDIGGESTRPGAVEVSAAEEQDRVLPVIEALAARTEAFLSIDTYRAETARLAVAAGAHIINDVHGAQREPDIARIAAESTAGLCLMHTGRGRETLPDLVADQVHFLNRSLEIAAEAGVERSRIVLDPGFGFAKNAEQDLELMTRFSELHAFGLPLLAGTSRKRFIGAMSGRSVAAERDVATAATTFYLRQQGAAIFRVHDIATNRDALGVANAVIAAERRLTMKAKA